MLKKALAVAALMLPVCFAQAQDYKVGDLEVTQPWSQELPPNAPNVAAYFVVNNHSAQADRLLSVDSPVSDNAQLHEHVNTDGLMKMRQVPNVEVPAHQQAVFAPGAHHVMLMAPKDRSLLQDGKQFPLTLHFEKAGALTVNVEVRREPPSHQTKSMHAQ
ncbi:copper chaperone PCu(A)C [Pseudomonas sp. R5(2019)]|uniref:copper chaperone PCu(A)C n=1 Tax=Pseudomonas sp. R5(2019) TaxID=2697566 RepID=UPI001411FB53|nr:copper chaperone PCu(A)C [Pseudomonas sp. R5(2019)]NBA95123.1 copper chaperone PCu(A)C [Pseudomonas sp. R5(2019)]